MFDDSQWTVNALRDGVPRAVFEEALNGLLRGPAAADEHCLELANTLISQADFPSEEAQAWRERFSSRRTELSHPAPKVA
jgi:hypothetical protein